MFRFLTLISLFVLGFSPVVEKNISEFQTTTHIDSVSLKNNYQKFDTLIFTKIGETQKKLEKKSRGRSNNRVRN